MKTYKGNENHDTMKRIKKMDELRLVSDDDSFTDRFIHTSESDDWIDDEDEFDDYEEEDDDYLKYE